MQDTHCVAVIGAGISGLAAAHHLRRLDPSLEVALFEREPVAGGLIRTVHVDGFTIEGGPDSFLASKPRGIGLCRELGLEDGLIAPDPAHRGTFVLRAGMLYPLPEGLSGLVPARLEPLLASALFSLEGKTRLAQEPEIPVRPGNGDETLAAFIERRFGLEVYERLIEPLMAGIYAGDGTLLSLAATFPQLRALEEEYGSVVRGLQARASTAPPRAGFLTPRDGMGELVAAVQSRLGNAVRTACGVTGIVRREHGYQLQLGGGKSHEADAVIVAVPAYGAASMLADVAPTAAENLATIPYASTVTITLAFDENDVPDGLNGYGYVVPRAEGRPVLASTWVSSKFPPRAPAGQALIRLFLGRYGQDEILAVSDEEIVTIARRELLSVLGISAEPLLWRLFRWPRALPQYTLGHLDRLAAIDEALTAVPGLVLAGNLRGVGIPDCIASGEQAAERIVQVLSASTRP